ncbi:hypothetical protein, partial [uncultured Gimesia sp.]|uniref:hypothetical protein n=1 Tax=uncultured Gimesia sp. TaxID=1678688 RepID=UPI002605C6CA
MLKFYTIRSLLLISILSLLLQAPIVVEAQKNRQQVSPDTSTCLKKLKSDKGLCVVLGLPAADQASFVIELTQNSELQIYFQSESPKEIAQVRALADQAGLLG